MASRRSTRGTRSSSVATVEAEAGASIASNDEAASGSSQLFRGQDSGTPEADAMQVETDLLGSSGGNTVLSSSASSPPQMSVSEDVNMTDHAAPASSPAGPQEPEVAEVEVEVPTSDGALADAPRPETATHEDGEEAAKGIAVEKGKVPSTAGRDRPTTKDECASSSSSSELLASLPVYLSAALPTSSSVQVFQYPTYAPGKPLPVPRIARERGIRPAMRVRPVAKRVEVELPLDLRAAVYNADRGEQHGEGADAAGGPIGGGSGGVTIKSEFGGSYTPSSSFSSKREARLERTRLESNLMPHQTQYMLGVIRNKALHLTPVDSIHQLRPSMHYLDAIESIKRQAKAAEDRSRDDADETEDGARRRANNEAATAKRKAQTLNVSFRGEVGAAAAAVTSGGSGNSASAGTAPRSSTGKTGNMDSRDVLMLADREAESERWIEVDWKMADSEQARKTFDAQLFATKRTPLKCTTRPREFLTNNTV